METKIRVVGGVSLNGCIKVSGSKNAALPLLTACVLTDQPLELLSVPHLADIQSLLELLDYQGVEVYHENNRVIAKASNVKTLEAPYDLVRKMRASFMVLGPLVARHGYARVSLPGGCAIGTRPIDLHLQGLQALGAEISLGSGYVEAKAPSGGLIGGNYTFPVITVTGTKNVMMAACLAHGTTQLVNAAREPEVVDLAECLINMGAIIKGAGTDQITIHGVEALKGTSHTVIPDRLEAGTYALAAAITQGEIILENVIPQHLQALFSLMEQAGINLKISEKTVHIKTNSGQKPLGVDAMTEPYPGLATDLQAQWMALMTLCNGASMITETIFENRFMHVPELCRMGAKITVHRGSALVRGVGHLDGAHVMATDLRASVSLVLAGLAARGETFVNRVYHLDRGYEKLEDKLRGCGARIERLKE